MLTDEDKARIVERVQFENDTRAALAPRKKSESWFQSSLGLLLIGSLMSSVLVPLFQYSQQSFTWHRQNRYDNVKYRLTMMRDCLREFVSAAATTSEAYERARPVLEGRILSSQPKDTERFTTVAADLNNRRFQQNAKVSALFIYFPRRSVLSSPYNTYLRDVTVYMQQLDAAVYCKMGTKGPVPTGGAPPCASELAQIDASMLTLDELYEQVVNAMRQQIGELEDESEKSM